MRQIVILFSFISLFTLFLNASPTRIMLLGDSITYDDAYQDSPNPRPASLRSGYRNYLWYLLDDAHYNVDFVGSISAGSAIIPPFDTDNEGYPGWKSAELANITYSKLIANPPDIILLHIGSNDWSDDVSGINSILNEVDRYERNYYHPIKVILARIINRKTHYQWTSNLNKNIQNLANSRIRSGDDIVVVDMEYGAGINYETDFQDPTHPNDTGYEKMAKVWFNTLTQILPTPQAPNPLIRPFVERFYRTILLRNGDEAGINYWVDKLGYNSLSAADLAREFIFSAEFKNQNLDDEAFLSVLYQAFFDRIPDESGLSYWYEQLKQGVSRFTVLNGFLYSIEFDIVAHAYNIESVASSEYFVTRFYTKALGRDAEYEGLSNWIEKLRTYQITAGGIAEAFFFSDEFTMKNTDNEEYLTLLYQTLFDREPDSDGLNQWLLKMNEGLSRKDVLENFIYSSEFKTLAQSYEIKL